MEGFIYMPTRSNSTSYRKLIDDKVNPITLIHDLIIKSDYCSQCNCGFTIPVAYNPKDLSTIGVSMFNDTMEQISTRTDNHFDPMTLNINVPTKWSEHDTLSQPMFYQSNNYQYQFSNVILYNVLDGMRPSYLLKTQFNQPSKLFLTLHDIVPGMNAFVSNIYDCIVSKMILANGCHRINPDKVELAMYKIHNGHTKHEIAYYPCYNIPMYASMEDNYSRYSKIFTVVVSPMTHHVGMFITTHKFGKRGNNDIIDHLHHLDQSNGANLLVHNHDRDGSFIYKQILSYTDDTDCVNKIHDLLLWYSKILNQTLLYEISSRNATNLTNDIYNAIGIWQRRTTNNSTKCTHVIPITISNLLNYLCINVSIDGEYRNTYCFNNRGDKVKSVATIQSIKIFKNVIDKTSFVKQGLDLVQKFTDENNYDRIRMRYSDTYRHAYSGMIDEYKDRISKRIQSLVTKDPDNFGMAMCLPLRSRMSTSLSTNTLPSLMKLSELDVGIFIRYGDRLVDYYQSSAAISDYMYRFTVYNYHTADQKDSAIQKTIDSFRYAGTDACISFATYMNIIKRRYAVTMFITELETKYHTNSLYDSSFERILDRDIENLKIPVTTYPLSDAIIRIFYKIYLIAFHKMFTALKESLVSCGVFKDLVEDYHSINAGLISNVDFQSDHNLYSSLKKQRDALLKDNVRSQRIDALNALKLEDMSANLIIQFNYYCESNVSYLAIQ